MLPVCPIVRGTKNHLEKPGNLRHKNNLSTVASFRIWRGLKVAPCIAPDISKRSFTLLAQYGERGIRTPDAFRHTRLPIVHLRPLGHLSLKQKGVD